MSRVLRSRKTKANKKRVRFDETVTWITVHSSDGENGSTDNEQDTNSIDFINKLTSLRKGGEDVSVEVVRKRIGKGGRREFQTVLRSKTGTHESWVRGPVLCREIVGLVGSFEQLNI